MPKQVFRIDSGGRIDRSQEITFKFNGRTYTGFSGDTLASALLANGVSIVGRSFKYHRKALTVKGQRGFLGTNRI